MPRTTPLPPHLANTAFSTATALQSGVSPKRLRSGDLEAPFRGVRTHHLDLARLQERCRAYAVRMPETHVFSHVTATLLLGAPLPAHLERRASLDVTAIAPARAPAGRRVIGHTLELNFSTSQRETDRELEHDAGAGAVRILNGFRMTAPEITWFSLASMLNLSDLVAVGDFLVTGDELAWTTRSALEGAIAAGARGCRLARVAAPQVRAGVGSRPETHLRLAISAAGLPEPVVNLRVALERHRIVVYPDLSWPDLKVAAEYEGKYHWEVEGQFIKDIERIERLIDEGWSVVRFTKSDVYARLDATVRRVELRLRERGWSER